MRIASASRAAASDRIASAVVVACAQIRAWASKPASRASLRPPRRAPAPAWRWRCRSPRCWGGSPRAHSRRRDRVGRVRAGGAGRAGEDAVVDPFVHADVAQRERHDSAGSRRILRRRGPTLVPAVSSSGPYARVDPARATWASSVERRCWFSLRSRSLSARTRSTRSCRWAISTRASSGFSVCVAWTMNVASFDPAPAASGGAISRRAEKYGCRVGWQPVQPSRRWLGRVRSATARPSAGCDPTRGGPLGSARAAVRLPARRSDLGRARGRAAPVGGRPRSHPSGGQRPGAVCTSRLIANHEAVLERVAHELRSGAEP